MNKNILNSPLQQLRRMAMILASIVAVVGVALMTACGSNDDPTDPTDPDYVAPYTISMRVLSNDGTNLLDPKAMGNILKDSVTVSFGDMSYQLDTIPSAKELPTGVPHEATDNFYGRPTISCSLASLAARQTSQTSSLSSIGTTAQKTTPCPSTIPTARRQLLTRAPTLPWCD